MQVLPEDFEGIAYAKGFRDVEKAERGSKGSMLQGLAERYLKGSQNGSSSGWLAAPSSPAVKFTGKLRTMESALDLRALGSRRAVCQATHQVCSLTHLSSAVQLPVLKLQARCQTD